MRIALCDDYQEDINYLKKLILECEICPEDVEFLEFTSGEEMLENFSKFALIFLDIKLNGISGTETAELIRLRDPEVPIVFYTNYDIMASKAIKTRPLHYMIKTSNISEHKSIIQNVLQNICLREDSPSLPVVYGGKTYILPLAQIIYISILDKGTAIWLRNEYRSEFFGELKKNQDPLEYTIKSGVKLENYYEQLKAYGFIYAKKSYIINARFIISRFKDSVLLKGGYELTVARSKKKQFDDQLADFWINHTFGGS